MQQQLQERGPVVEHSLHETFHLLTWWSPERNKWSAYELLQGSPLARVRQALGGRWTRSEGSLTEDMSSAFWNASNNRKAFVLRMPYGMSREACVRVMRAQ